MGLVTVFRPLTTTGNGETALQDRRRIDLRAGLQDEAGKLLVDQAITTFQGERTR
jgi:hypothetical protein